MENTTPPIEVPATVTPEKETRLAIVNGQPLNVAQVKQVLSEITRVMKDCMTEGIDYGTIKGCGDKVCLFQPGAQKLSLMFALNPEARAETITDYPNLHRGYRFTVRVTHGTKFADGVGECATLESKYRYRTGSRECPNCGAAAIGYSKDRNEYYCWDKKGGCGAKFVKGSPLANKIEQQQGGKMEVENPADAWNTVRKMAYKRAFVHAIINATNTSELWTQDFDDMDDVEEPATNQPAEQPKPQASAATPKATPKATPNPAPFSEAIDWRKVEVPYGNNKGKVLSVLRENQLKWYAENFHITESYTDKATGQVKSVTKENLDIQKRFRLALDEAAKEFNWE